MKGSTFTMKEVQKLQVIQTVIDKKEGLIGIKHKSSLQTLQTLSRRFYN